LLIDLFWNDVAGVNISKQAALDFLESKLMPDDEIGVFTSKISKGVLVNQYFTQDLDEIRTAVRKIKPAPEAQLNPDDPMPMSINEPSSISSDLEGFEYAAESYVRDGTMAQPFNPYTMELQHVNTQISSFIQVLKDVAVSLRHIPGRKHVLFFSAGIPAEHFSGISSMRIRDEFDDLSRQLSSADASVFSINPIAKSKQLLTKKQAFGEADSLKSLSEYTGGGYFENKGDFAESAEKINHVTSHFYVLGYYVDDRWDGKYHEIKVELDNKDYAVHCQSGYFNSKLYADFSSLEKNLHLIDLF
jgi:VWFA-related protein